MSRCLTALHRFRKGLCRRRRRLERHPIPADVHPLTGSDAIDSIGSPSSVLTPDYTGNRAIGGYPSPHRLPQSPPPGPIPIPTVSWHLVQVDRWLIDPQQVGYFFFCTSMINLAFSNATLRRSFSLFSFLFSFDNGYGTFGFGPRRFSFNPAHSP